MAKRMSGSGRSDDSILVPNASSAESFAVSAQQLQDIYYHLTKKTQQLQKSFDNATQVDRDSIRQLHHRIEQTTVQYHILQKGCHVVVYHVDDLASRFDSFEKFDLMDLGQSALVESVYIEYNFLVKVPHGSDAQPYKISINLASRIAIESKMRKTGVFLTLPRVLQKMGMRTSLIEVDYVDYSIARALLHTVEEWVQRLPTGVEPVGISRLKAWSHLFPTWFPIIAATIVCVIIFEWTGKSLPDDAGMAASVRFIILGGLAIFLSHVIARQLGRLTERYVDSWTEESFIKLSAADEREVARVRHENRNGLLLAALNMALSFVVPIAGKIFQTALGEMVSRIVK